jgi:hypothetical protein
MEIISYTASSLLTVGAVLTLVMHSPKDVDRT